MLEVAESVQVVRVPRARRKYTDREKAEILAIYDACGSLAETSKATGIPDSTLSPWILNQRGLNPDISAMREGKELNSTDLSAKFDRIAHLATSHVIARLEDPKRASKTPMPHLMNAAGISVDKSQLLKGLPTEIVENVASEKVLVLLVDALSDAIDVTPVANTAELLNESPVDGVS